MNKKHKKLAFLSKTLVAASIAGCFGTVAAQTRYTVVPLCPGINWCWVGGINASGHVVGSSSQGAFLHDGTKTVYLGKPNSVASDINDSGVAVGTYRSPENNRDIPFKWGINQPFAVLGDPGGRWVGGGAINESGHSVFTSSSFNEEISIFKDTDAGLSFLTKFQDPYGSAGISEEGDISVSTSNDSYRGRAYLIKGSNVIEVSYPGKRITNIHDMNRKGVFTGVAVDEERGTYGEDIRQVFISDGTIQPDGSRLKLLGYFGEQPYPVDINDNGHITGFHSIREEFDGGVRWYGRGFFYDGTAMRDLGTFGGKETSASALNNRGTIVGVSRDVNGIIKPFGWSVQEGMYDITTRVDNMPAGMVIWGVSALSDNGTVAANTNSGMVLLRPTTGLPQPTAAAIGPVTADDPVQVGTQVNARAAFTDINTEETHNAVWTWGNGTTGQGSVQELYGKGTATGSTTFTLPGVYDIKLTLTDSSSLQSEASKQVIVYDPSAGFVTGGGWLNSPSGAYKKDPYLFGRATFAFVSRYVKGATIPSGKTEFQFSAANLRFHSDSYEWMVVSGARAQYKGVGSINGAGQYKFQLTAVDGAINGTGTDRFRMKIWHYDETLKADVVDYDNQVSSDGEGSDKEGTEISGGSIVIQKSK